MAQDSEIAWTQQTWNPLRGCSKISPGCENCYAMHVAARFSGPGQPYEGLAKRNPTNWTGGLRLLDDKLYEPLRRRKPTTYFVNSMSDLFHEKVPRDWIAKIFGVMAYCRQHTFQVLTKRAVRMHKIMHGLSIDECLNAAGVAPDFDPAWPLENVWLGFSAENQECFDDRASDVAQLMRGGWQVWTSTEPLLGPIAMQGWDGKWQRNWLGEGGIRWVVVGGESAQGSKCRPCDVAWVRSVIEQCRAADVPVFVKQMGSRPLGGPNPGWTGGSYDLGLIDRKGADPDEWPEDLRVRQFPRAREAVS